MTLFFYGSILKLLQCLKVAKLNLIHFDFPYCPYVHTEWKKAILGYLGVYRDKTCSVQTGQLS